MESYRDQVEEKLSQLASRLGDCGLPWADSSLFVPNLMVVERKGINPSRVSGATRSHRAFATVTAELLHAVSSKCKLALSLSAAPSSAFKSITKQLKSGLDMLRRAVFASYPSMEPHQSQYLCEQSIESVVMPSLHRHLIHLFRYRYRPEDEAYAAKLNLLTSPSLTPMHFGVAEENKLDSDTFRTSYSAGIEAFARLPSCTTPYTKLAAVVEGFKAIAEAAKKESHVGIDSILPLLCFTLICAKVPSLHAECCFMTHFLNPKHSQDAHGYCLGTLTGIVEWLININVESDLDGSIPDEVICAAKALDEASANPSKRGSTWRRRHVRRVVFEISRESSFATGGKMWAGGAKNAVSAARNRTLERVRHRRKSISKSSTSRNKSTSKSAASPALAPISQVPEDEVNDQKSVARSISRDVQEVFDAIVGSQSQPSSTGGQQPVNAQLAVTPMTFREVEDELFFSLGIT